MSKFSHRLSGIEKDTFDWFKDEKDRSRSRMDREELTNDEFLELLLVIYNHHLSGPITAEAEAVDHARVRQEPDDDADDDAGAGETIRGP